MREIRTLRAKWRELETEPRTRLNGHEGGNPGNSQAGVLTGHRASSRPYIAFALVIRRSERRLGTLSQVRAAPNGCENGADKLDHRAAILSRVRAERN